MVVVGVSNPLMGIPNSDGSIVYINALNITSITALTQRESRGVRIDFGSTQHITMSGYTVDEFADLVRQALDPISTTYISGGGRGE